jgi:hypothetical protein
MAKEAPRLPRALGVLLTLGAGLIFYWRIHD